MPIIFSTSYYEKLKKYSIFLALLFHVSGLIGILTTPYKDWFIEQTSTNLLLMFGLLVLNHQNKTFHFFLFLIITLIVGIGVELIGVHTGLLFGEYVYGKVMGIKFFNVPLLIGIQWFVTIYCCTYSVQMVEQKLLRKLINTTNEVTDLSASPMAKISIIVDAALLATLFDFVIEPVAQKLGFWYWQNGVIPTFNYTCWFFISMALVFVMQQLNKQVKNYFAIHLLCIQILFFLVLRFFL